MDSYLLADIIPMVILQLLAAHYVKHIFQQTAVKPGPSFHKEQGVASMYLTDLL